MSEAMLRAPIAQPQHIERPSRLRLIPALTAIVFLRRRIGARMLNFVWILPIAAFLGTIQLLTGRSPDDYALRIFAVAVVILGIAHRVHLEVAKSRGDMLPHSYSRGVSLLSWLPLPATFIHLVLDPALCGWLGWEALHHVSPWLGYWLMIAALMLAATEYHDHRHALHRSWDIRDGEVEGRMQSEAIMGRQRRSAQAPTAPAPVVTLRSSARAKWWPFGRRSYRG